MEQIGKILYIIPVYQSFALAVLLFINGGKMYNRARLIMGGFQFLAAVYFFFNFLYAIRNYEILIRLFPLILPIITAFIPLFYLYLLAVTTPGFTFRKSHGFHFVPSAAFLFLNLPFLFASDEVKISYLSNNLSVAGHSDLIFYFTLVYMAGIFGMLAIQLFFYFFKVLKLFHRHQAYIQEHYSYMENLSLNWLLAMLVCLVVFFISNQMLFLFGYSRDHFSPVVYNIIMLGITLFTGYYALSQKELKPFIDKNEALIYDVNSQDSHIIEESIVDSMEEHSVNNFLSESYRTENEAGNSFNIENAEEEAKIFVKYAGSQLSESLKNALLSRLDSLIVNEKIFKNESLSLEDVALLLQTNSKYVSQIINERYGKNFYNYINTFRVQEAQKLLLSAGWEKYSMLGIARMVGFGSKSTFNSSFKRITGFTPSDFIKSKRGIHSL